jgi:GT2 family glycosyltransferase
MPSVSILIPCFNAERWVAQAIHSALDQTHEDKEVIVVDDGSTDGSLDVIKSFGNQIRWETGSNRGGNVARNRLLHLATGDWLQYLDADDYLLPQKVAAQVSHLKSNHDADVIFSSALFEEWSSKGEPKPLQFSPIPEPHDPWILLARWRLPQTGGSLWRKQALLACGKWDEALPCCQEHDLYLRLLKSGARFVHFGESHAVYRYWPGLTVSRRNPTMVLENRLRILDRLHEEVSHHHELREQKIRAISTTRFEIARTLWGIDREQASSIIEKVLVRDIAFKPSGPAASTSYRLLFGLFGFGKTEQIANYVRRIRMFVSRNAPE